MRRFPLYFLLLACLLLGETLSSPASDAIPEPDTGKSATVKQPHVTAELISETTSFEIGKPFQVALHLHMDPKWHTYWINPGGAGLATAIKWTLPADFASAGPIQWPTPEIHAMGPITTYGYGGDVYLLTTITPTSDWTKLKLAPKEVPSQLEIKAHATWLVCQEECIPGKAELTLTLNLLRRRDGLSPGAPAVNEAFFKAARARLPVPNTRWDVKAAYQPVGLGESLVIRFQDKGSSTPLGNVYFFPEQGNILDPNEEANRPDAKQKLSTFDLVLGLQQNGEKPDTLSGILVSDQPLIGGAKSVYVPAFSTHSTGIQVNSSSLTPPATNNSSSTANVSSAPGGAGLGPSPATPAVNTASATPQPFLLAVLGAAFLGGLILNLMPCVLPVLSLKVFSLIRHAGENAGSAWRQGVAFAAGVVVSFWILAGLLLALRAAGNHLGWGFQMQSPGFVLALTFLFFLLSLNLLGVFELGASLVGLDAKASSHLGGLTSSFANGALATLAATPCTAPFMGSSVGFAAQQSAPISLLVFTFLALGMAAPYLALTAFPGALRFVPRPGPWMESLRQFMGFLLLGTVIFLVYVFGALVGEDQIANLLGALLLAGFAAWIFGRWSSPAHSPATRASSWMLSAVLLFLAAAWGAQLTHASSASTAPGQGSKNDWQVYSPEAVQKALAEKRPVFVDFTAAWCLSCKVNERVALDIDSTRKVFTQKHVALFRGDWTHSDPEISKTLRQYNRDGVPLYLLYSPENPTAPQVLPEVLTPEIVQGAVLGQVMTSSHSWVVWTLSILVVLVVLAPVIVGGARAARRRLHPI